MKLNGNAVKPGNVIEHNGRLWTAVKVAHVKPGKGGRICPDRACAISAMAQTSMSGSGHQKQLSG